MIVRRSWISWRARGERSRRALSLDSLVSASTVLSWWLTKSKYSPSLTSQTRRDTVGPQTGKPSILYSAFVAADSENCITRNKLPIRRKQARLSLQSGSRSLNWERLQKPHFNQPAAVTRVFFNKAPGKNILLQIIWQEFQQSEIIYHNNLNKYFILSIKVKKFKIIWKFSD